jgi:hypothetical protein
LSTTRKYALRSKWGLAAAVLTAAATVAHAQPPYAIHGLHTELVFTEAVTLAEKLGGKCKVTSAETQGGGTSAQCEYAHCNAQNNSVECKPQDARTAGLAIAAQPILSIGLDAPGDSARLASIVLVYEGSNDIVADYLQQTFGPPDNVPRTNEQSWSHAHRLAWTHGIYRVGLLDSPKLIILGADRTQE